MKQKLLISLIALSIFAANSCRKDPKVYPNSDCYDLHYNPNGPSLNYTQPDTQHIFGKFNPNDANEICYYLGIQSANNGEIRRKNFASGLDQLVTPGIVWSFISYSSNGWLISNYAGNNIWKVKENGDSLTQLTFDGVSMQPYWDNSGERFVFQKDLGSSNLTIICDKNGQHLDTIVGFFWHKGVWSKNNDLLVSIAFDHLSVYSFSSGIISEIPGHAQNDASKDGILDVTISPDSRKVYWCNGWGIFYQDILTGQTGQIQTSCDARRFNSIDISPDGTKLLCTSYNQKMLDYNFNSVYIEAKMYRMNPDGSDLTELEF